VQGTSVDVAPEGASFPPRIPRFRSPLFFLVDFQIDSLTGEEARVTVDETNFDVSTLRRCKVGDGMDLEEESTVVDESDLSWVEMVAIQYFVHQVEVPKPLEGRAMGLLQDDSCVSSRLIGP
jgi:hypothetical protein